MATRSIPTVSNFRAAAAILTLVPTPSVPETSTGSLYFRAGKRKNPANEPISPSTSLRCVARTIGLIRRTRRSPSSMSTPALLYVTGFFNDSLQAECTPRYRFAEGDVNDFPPFRG